MAIFKVFDIAVTIDECLYIMFLIHIILVSYNFFSVLFPLLCLIRISLNSYMLFTYTTKLSL